MKREADSPKVTGWRRPAAKRNPYMPKTQILVADDSQVFRGWLEQTLQEWGYRVVAIGNGLEAWKIIQSHGSPSMAILDWEMPGLTGLEICRKARTLSDHRQPYIIVLSSKEGGGNIAHALEMGADDYVLKPVTPDELRARIHVGIRCLTAQKQLNQNITTLIKAQKERLQALEVQRKLNAENEQILHSISAILIGVNQDDQITQWNTVAEETFGISASSVLRHPLVSCGIQWEWGEILQAIASCHDTVRPIRLHNIQCQRANGQRGVLKLKINPIRTNKNDSRTEGILLLGEDVTDYRLMERQLVQAQKLESIGQLAAGIAHEINTPTQYVSDNLQFLQDGFSAIVTVVDTCGALLAELERGVIPQGRVKAIRETFEEADVDYLKQEIPKALDQSLEGAGRVATIVRAMKDFSHPSSGEMNPRDLNKALESTVTVARNEWKYVADVVMDFDASLPLVPCLADEFNQVILNLIVNAAHAIGDTISKDAGEKGTITVSTTLKGKWVEVRVADTGTGIPESVRDKIFDPFFTTKEVGRGTGQGLAIVHDIIVNKHKGTLHFETEMGRGTAFIIRLPLHPSE